MYVFCELCQAQRKPGGIEYLITSCKHIFCRKCAASATICPMCKSQCRTSVINTDLPPNVKEYFINQTDQLKKIGKIYQFQNSKMDQFIEVNWNVFEEYESRKQKFLKLKQMYEAYKKGILDEQRLIVQLQQKKKQSCGNSDTLQLPHTPATQSSIKEDFFQQDSLNKFK